jgi:hypothetical protein
MAIPAIAPPDRAGEEDPAGGGDVEVDVVADDVGDLSRVVDGSVVAGVVEAWTELTDVLVVLELLELDKLALASATSAVDCIWHRTNDRVKLYPVAHVVNRGQHAWLTPTASPEQDTEPDWPQTDSWST